MSEDSSSEEDVSRFQEAVDEKFTQAFSSKKADVNDESCIESTTNVSSLPSLRYSKEEDNFISDHRSLKVTPEFQKFVAKKLDKALERYLDESETDTTPVALQPKSKKKKRTSEETGIKLFKSSSDIIGEFQEDVKENGIVRSNRKYSQIFNDKEELEKAKEVAVDPAVILSGKETDAWSKDVKGEVIRVKKTKRNSEFSIEQKGYIPLETWSGRSTRFIL